MSANTERGAVEASGELDQCSNCAHSHGKHHNLRCRRYPPIQLEEAVEDAVVSFAGFPQVLDTDWCGEYKPDHR